MGGYSTYISLPTKKSFWHQTEANAKYGIDNTIENGNKKNKYWSHDDETFKNLIKETDKLKSPYLNIILTLSMHGPYESDFLSNVGCHSPFHYPSNYSKEFCHYLDKCYFSDIQIGKYLDYIKKSGKYKNTLIVICSDHETKTNSLKFSCSEDLPLIIANSNIPKERFYQGRINQIDLFPTILDMFGIQSKWRGLGHSLLRKDYTEKITDKERQISDIILRGNYFSKSSAYKSNQ